MSIVKPEIDDLKGKWAVIVFWLALVLLVGYRVMVVTQFGARYTDSDQVVMWAGTSDYSEGEFHQPRFYGQAYNSMLESLLAVPLYKCGIPFHIALPLVTTLLALFPFLLLSSITYRSGKIVTAAGILLIALIFPLHYDLLSTLPRGFVTGIAIASLNFLFLKKTGRRSFFLASLITVIAWSVNPNSVLLSIPLLMFLWKDRLNLKGYYLYSLSGVIFGLIIHFGINSFYHFHPEVIVHEYSSTWSFALLGSGLLNLRQFIGSVSPFFHSTWALWIVIPAVQAFWFLREKKLRIALICAAFLLLLICSLGLEKVHDGSDALFLSFGRMYLALPVCMAFYFSQTRSGLILNKYISWLIIVTVIFTGYKIFRFQEVVTYETQRDTTIAVRTVSEMEDKCTRLAKFCDSNKVDLVIIGDDPNCDFYNYSCPASIPGFPKTLRSGYERRYWRWKEDRDKIYPTVLFIYSEKDSTKSTLQLMKNNSLKTVDLVRKLGLSFPGNN